MYIKTNVKFQTLKTEDQITVSLKNTQKMINVEKKKRLPVNRSYANITAFGEKILIVEDSHSKKLKEIN